MKLEELKVIPKGTPVVSYTKTTWIEGTFAGFCTMTNLGSFDNFKDACEAIVTGKGRKKTVVVIVTEDGDRRHVSPKSVHLMKRQ